LDPTVESVDSIWRRCEQLMDALHLDSDWVVDLPVDAVWPKEDADTL
jgi:hypothetical protein